MGPQNAFLPTLWKNPISTGNKNTRIEKIIVTVKFSTSSREKVK